MLERLWSRCAALCGLGRFPVHDLPVLTILDCGWRGGIVAWFCCGANAVSFLVRMQRDWVVSGVTVSSGDDVFVDASEMARLTHQRVAFVVRNPDRLRLENARQLIMARSNKPCCNQ